MSIATEVIRMPVGLIRRCGGFMIEEMITHELMDAVLNTVGRLYHDKQTACIKEGTHFIGVPRRQVVAEMQLSHPSDRHARRRANKAIGKLLKSKELVCITPNGENYLLLPDHYEKKYVDDRFVLWIRANEDSDVQRIWSRYQYLTGKYDSIEEFRVAIRAEGQRWCWGSLTSHQLKLYRDNESSLFKDFDVVIEETTGET